MGTLLPPVDLPCSGAALALSADGSTVFQFGGLGLSGQALTAAQHLNLALPSTTFRGQSPTSSPWVALPAMPTARHLATATAFRDGTVVIGGKGATFEPTRDAEVFPPDTWSWEVL